jgi:hypothetical protein
MTTPPDPELTRDELMTLYQISLDEYRFQVNLNWSRTQYYLTLNVGIIAIATGILQIAKGRVGDLTAGLYFAGFVCCALSLAASRVQKRYYESIRDHKAKLETALQMGAYSIRTTPGMGGFLSHLGRVTTLLNVVLVILGLMNIAGILTVLLKP